MQQIDKANIMESKNYEMVEKSVHTEPGSTFTSTIHPFLALVLGEF
jgi:hypothetical protein